MTASAKARSAARLAAVQALYQHEMEKTQLATLLDEFHRHRLGAEIEEVEYAAAEVAFFDECESVTDVRSEEAGSYVQGFGEVFDRGVSLVLVL